VNSKQAVLKPVPLSDDDYVFDQATDMLWNPLVGPGLRAALYKVLAQTPGVQVRAGATDRLGRAAVEISRYETAAQVTAENPAPGRSRTITARAIPRPGPRAGRGRPGAGQGWSPGPAAIGSHR